MTDDHDLVLVVDFGAQYAQLIARRVREARVYSEIVPHTTPVEQMLARGPKAIILSGGPSSVYEEGAPAIDPGIFTAGTPVFGMCYGFQLMAQGLGGTVSATGAREYGRTPVSVSAAGTLLADIPAAHNVWMSHGDSVTAAPDGFAVLASTATTPVAAFENVAAGLAGVQWHPEVLHSEHGQRVLEHFLWDIAGCRQTWTIGNIAEEQIERVRQQIGDSGLAICGLSGGVDSAVAAAIVVAGSRLAWSRWRWRRCYGGASPSMLCPGDGLRNRCAPRCLALRSSLRPAMRLSALATSSLRPFCRRWRAAISMIPRHSA